MDDLKQIKKHYGEEMMHLCRELFPTLLETEGLLFKVLSSKFPYSRHIAKDIIEKNAEVQFKSIIYSNIDVENNNTIKSIKTPKELLEEVGYDLYECHNEEEIQAFKKYYAPREELCTFHGGRLNRCHVFFAVKKDVDKIKREDFNHPERQDRYGTSVISIQFTRDSTNTLSIKNRYNHTVNNPDATFSNDLENINIGLTEAFNQTYGLNINSSKSEYEIPGYVLASDGKYYQYNYEIDNVYYCPDNIIIDNFQVKKLDKSKYIVLDKYILDLTTKEIKEYKEIDTAFPSILKDSFLETIPKIESINVEVDKETKNRIITINKDIIITLNNRGEIIKYDNEYVTKIGDHFLDYNYHMEEINIPNVEEIKNNFLNSNTKISKIDFPKLKKIGYNFLEKNRDIKEVNLKEVTDIGFNFLCTNKDLEEIDLPNLEEIGDHALFWNEKIKRANLPKLKMLPEDSFRHNKNMEVLIAPNVEEIEGNVLTSNLRLKELHMPKVKTIDINFLSNNIALTKINILNVEEIGPDFLSENDTLKSIALPNVKKIGFRFLRRNKSLNSIDLPNVEDIGENFLDENQALTSIDLPNVVTIKSGFLSKNKILSSISIL